MTTWGAGAAEWQMRWHELVKAVVRVHSPSGSRSNCSTPWPGPTNRWSLPLSIRTP